MTNVTIQYNPFTVETLVKIDGIPIDNSSKLYKYKNERLQLWLEELLPILAHECNDNLDIVYYGTQLDYNDLVFAVDEYIQRDEHVSVAHRAEISKAANMRIQDLVDLFEEMQQNCPFEDLKSKEVRDNFMNAIGGEFEVSVIATMSSGKSTLINAMLGCELMPAKNEACTATIARITDVDGKDCFSAVCKGFNNQEICRTDDLTAEQMAEYNQNAQVSDIDIEGEIPFVSSKDIALVLVDTPGPNNSRTQEHRIHTHRIIKEKTMPMVLYVLNATQLSTDDDKSLLEVVANEMKVGGKQSKDRFIFAVNKIDTFDTEKGESVADALQNVRDYLAERGIVNPNIYPTSAEMAKVIRLHDNGYPLSKRQNMKYQSYWAFNDEKQMHLAQYAPLSSDSRTTLEQRIADARAAQDEHAEALIHTGVPAIEIAINEYLTRYAVTAKVSSAVDTFRKKIESKQLQSKMLQEMTLNKERREKLVRDLQNAKKQLSDGKAGQAYAQKIKDISMESDVNARITQVRTKYTKVLKPDGANSNVKMRPLEVEQFMLKLIASVNNLQSDVQTDLEQLMEDTVVSGAQKILKEYQQHLESLITGNAIEKSSFESRQTIELLAGELPDVTQLISKYRVTEQVANEVWVENTSKKWYKPWTWLQSSGRYKTVYSTEEYVDKSRVYNDFVNPIIGNFEENIQNAKAITLREGEHFKQFFLGEMQKLDQVIQGKVIELEQLGNDEKLLQEKMESDREKIAWLNEFIVRLNNLLKV